MIEESRTLFTSFSSKVKPEDGKPGEIEVFLQINGAAIPSTVLVKLRKLTGKTIDYLLDMEGT